MADGGSETDDEIEAIEQVELWCSSGETLVHIDLNEADGTVANLTTSFISDLDVAHNSFTMLDDGSLVGACIAHTDEGYNTQISYIPAPPRDGSDVTPVQLGIMPDHIGLEALYTDCDGRLYGMDTSANAGSAKGNRLIRFTGDYLAGDFTDVVISDHALGGDLFDDGVARIYLLSSDAVRIRKPTNYRSSSPIRRPPTRTRRGIPDWQVPSPIARPDSCW